MDLLTALLITVIAGVGLYLLRKSGKMDALIMEVLTIACVIVVILCWCSFFGIFGYLRGVHFSLR